MQFSQQGIIGSFLGTEDTTPDGHQIFGVVGDSNADGRGASIPTVGAATLYNWNGSAFDEITTGTVANDGSYGSIYQQLATDYKSATGYIVNLVNGAAGGSEFYPNGDNNNWYTSGTLYSAFTTKMTNALADRGLSKPKAIIITLGINDIRGAVSIANIQTGIDSLFSRLISDYPGVKLLVVIPGRNEVGGNDARSWAVRSYLVQKAEDNADVNIVSSAGMFIGVTGGYNVDNLHYSQDTNNTIGSQISRWFTNSAISNKWARSVVSSHVDALSTNRKTLMTNFITDQYNDGNYFKLENLHIFKTTAEGNIFADWTFCGYGIHFPTTPATFTMNSEISTPGNSAFAVGYTPSIYIRASGQTDLICGVKLKTRTTGSGTNAVMFSRFDASGWGIRCNQTGSVTRYTVNNTGANQKDGSETSLTAGNLYSVARNGTTMYMVKNYTTDASATQASDGHCAGSVYIGLNNNNGTYGNYFNGAFEYWFAAKYVGFDLQSFYDDMEYLVAHWND